MSTDKEVLDLEQVRKDILVWAVDFVEVPNPKLGGWAPCPFARRARMENKVLIDLGTLPEVDCNDIAATWDDTYEVIIFAYERSRFTVEEIEQLVERNNRELFMPMNLMCLEDHPDAAEVVNDVCFNQGQYILLLFQRLSKVNDFSAALKDKGYYDTWPKEYYDRVVSWRTQNEPDGS